MPLYSIMHHLQLTKAHRTHQLMMLMTYILLDDTEITIHIVILNVTGIGIRKIIHVDVENINVITNIIKISKVSNGYVSDVYVLGV